MKPSLFSIVGGSLLLSLTACNFSEQKVDTAGEVVEITAADLNYANVNSKFISVYCLSCHSPAGGNRAGINLEGYSNVMSHLEGIESTVFVESSMPPSGSPAVSEGASALLRAWLDAGAPQN